MKTPADLNKTANLAKIIAEQNRLPSSIAKMLQTSGVTKQLQIMDRYDFGKLITPEVLKTINQSNKHLKLLTSNDYNWFPESTFSKIASIASKQHSLVNSLERIDWYKLNPLFKNQIPNINSAFSNLSAELASIAAKHQKWDLVEDFDKISDKAVTINEAIDIDGGITDENLLEIKGLLNSLEIKIDKKDRNIIEILFKLIALLSFIIAVRGVIEDYKPKPNYATKEEVTTIVKDGFKNVQKSLKENKQNEKVRVRCRVMLKPRKRSKVITYLPANYDLIVLNKFHKWAYISYLNPKDGLPETGWVLKKYIVKGN